MKTIKLVILPLKLGINRQPSGRYYAYLEVGVWYLETGKYIGSWLTADVHEIY